MARPRPSSRMPASIVAPEVAAETWAQTRAGFRTLVERITPWLLDLGSWIFGALIAFSLVILGALLTIGPVDRAVLIATAAFALALPPDIAGFFLLRLAADMKKVDLEEVATQAFVEAGFSVEGEPSKATAESEKRRSRVALRYSYSLLTLAVLLTLVGVTATLWHMAWWIALLFAVMAVVSPAIVVRAVTATGSNTTWRSPAGDVEPHRSASAPKGQTRQPVRSGGRRPPSRARG